jgi:hypothetical protein
MSLCCGLPEQAVGIFAASEVKPLFIREQVIAALKSVA